MAANDRYIRAGLLGLLLGGVVSVMLIELNLLLIPLLVVWWVVRLSRIDRTRMASHVLVPVVAVCVVLIAMVLPVKNLDRRVGPMAYGQMPLEDLTQRLREDWGVSVMVWDWESRQRVVAFQTDRRMSRRELLHLLAERTDLELNIGYCGTSATFLFGAHPSFTSLRPADSPSCDADADADDRGEAAEGGSDGGGGGEGRRPGGDGIS